MSRKELHSRSARRRKSAEAELRRNVPAGEDGPTELPPRRKKFPSSIHKLYKWYYNLLFLLFVALVVFLFWYGNEFSR